MKESNELKQKALELRRKYMREWLRKYRKEHPEKIKQYRENYWINKAKKLLEQERGDN